MRDESHGVVRAAALEGRGARVLGGHIPHGNSTSPEGGTGSSGKHCVWYMAVEGRLDRCAIP
jgi:hypothetical protein